ncbi:glycosyltransferase family 4 protein [Erythrobacter sp. THAF29]|uniref:glycosyltransferase family 4 protein n=1 Tax=Erythrobacter sp. THAF29 TaxID=2587851 RepID=UPI0012685BDD|nr:glycosyltransferase family 4 protein [Erythrobacter sp. THAF29]QFT77345.1 Glycogen synthase [Erythrobacter sp. THAF29]
MNPRRIVILNDRSAALGGATSLALLSARLLSEAGHEVVYVTGDDGTQAELPSSVELIALGGRPLLELPALARTAKGLWNRDAHALVCKVIREFAGPETVFHLHGWAQVLSPSVMGALARVEDSLVIHAHDFFHACPNGTYFDFVDGEVCTRKPMSAGCFAANCDKRSYAQKLFRTARMAVKKTALDLGSTRALIAMIHPYMADHLARAGISRDRMRVVRNPVRPFVRDRVQAEKNREVFFIGRIEHEKGADLAISVAIEAGRPIRVIGEGSDRERLAAQYPQVQWEGWKSHEQIAQLISKARGLVMPSRLPEPFGLVALEALQSGVPLVAFADSFIGREAAERGCAFLAADRKPGSLADAIGTLDDDEAVARASRRAFEDTSDLSTIHESWLERLLELYREVLSADRAPSSDSPASTIPLSRTKEAISQ